MFGKSTSTFDRLLEKATSQLLLEPDWDSILQIVDQIRQGDVQGKYAVAAIRRKINQENPHISMFGLQVLESCAKNCGSIVHDEIATKDFMEYFKEMVKKRADPVKAKVLELIQVWSHAFRNETTYKVVQDTYNLMKMEGYTFPTLKESDAMFSAERAPEWKDSECCHRCRVQFGTFQRKHHCRACGQIFCQKCSSKNSIIPKFGIEKEVRVCDSCYDQINKSVGGPKKEGEDDLPAEYLSSSLAQQSQQTPAQKSEQEIQEEEELQLALAISMSEAQAKEKERSRLRTNYGNYSSSNTTSSSDNAVYAQPAKVSAPVLDTSDMDPELARYLNRNYWEQRQDDTKAGSGGGSGGGGVAPSTTQPSAPVAAAEPAMSNPGTTGSSMVRVQEKYQNGETDDEEQFLNALRGSIEIFVNRMKSNSQRGRSIANDSSVQSLFMTLNAMHPQLMKYVQSQEEMRAHYESLQDKLAQLKDARDALDSLREEHREKRRREQEELERQRQIQMAHKLEILRQKKQEYLEYQRQLALQRMREQEMEMQMRLEQQKHMQQMKAMHYAYPQMYGQPGQQTFSPGGSAEGSPLHQPHPPAGPQGAAYPPPGQPGMTMPPGAAPGAPGSQMPPQMGGPPATMAGQPVFNPAMPGQVSQAPGGVPMGAPVPPGNVPPGGYQQPPPPGGYQPPVQGGFPPSTQPGNVPPGQQQSQPNYAPGQPSMGYASFNMQSMSGALPPGQGQPPGQQPPPQALQQGQQYPAPPPGQYIPQQGAPPPQGQQQQQQPPPPQQQQQQQLPPGNEAQLISFD